MKETTELMSNILKELKEIKLHTGLTNAILNKICDKLYEEEKDDISNIIESLLEKEGLSAKTETRLHVVKPKDLPKELEEMLSNFIKDLNEQGIEASLDEE